MHVAGLLGRTPGLQLWRTPVLLPGHVVTDLPGNIAPLLLREGFQKKVKEVNVWFTFLLLLLGCGALLLVHGPALLPGAADALLLHAGAA